MYILALDTPNSQPHPTFQYEEAQDALALVDSAIEHGYLIAPRGIVIVTGPGTIYKVVSEEQQASPPKEELPFVLIIQVAGGQLPPMGFSSKENMKAALDAALANGVLRHFTADGHEYTFIHTCPGTVFMPMTTEAFMEKQRQAMAEHMRQQQAEEAPKGGLIITGN